MDSPVKNIKDKSYLISNQSLLRGKNNISQVNNQTSQPLKFSGAGSSTNASSSFVF